MRVKLLGVRGSIPTTGSETAFYGGNTSCVEVWEDDFLLILDGGSGIQKANAENELRHKRIDILLSHLHLDHIQGLGFFRYFFDPSMDIHIWGPKGSTKPLRAKLSRYLSPPLFPVLIRDLPCQLTLHEIENSTFEIGPFTINSAYVIHPGPTVGYRIKGNHSTFTYIPDHEPALGKNGMVADSKWVSGYNLAQGTDLLFHDSQYTATEYRMKIGWGHSSFDDAGKFADLAGVNHLLFAHHDPNHSDNFLNETLSEFQQQNSYRFKNELAREGEVYLLK